MKKELKSPGFLTIKMSKLYEYDMRFEWESNPSRSHVYLSQIM